ncbi:MULTISPECIES: adenylate/guanylate cyclase domain-containing protein [Methylobacterium]|jgi:adenylate cyclase|uniref:Putative adenylate/guanylate cyclase n=2 Tax=Methylobacterium aquaticum TaxID=270351 RepID=A0A0C6FQI8_9HYPH|nr:MULTISPECIES: adenylate/guanylate cyclase domain-containing protein [Methylobacterium]BAQ49312.1 putative adenylate/guanylate cyclase [Methylobacterium aquaticum]
MPPPPISLADPVGLFSAELPARIEQGFERRALAPRIGVVLILLLGALADYGHGERTGHWVVLGAYGLVTLLAAAGARARSKRVRSWLPLAATCADAAIAVYVVADHVPRYSGEAHLATDAVSLLPAYLFLLQTGMRLRPRLAALFAALVSVGWATALAFLLHPARLGPDGAHVLVRQGMGLAAFAVASGFVVSTTAWMRSAAAAALRAGEERLMLSRFLPDGVATEVVRTGGTASVAERHATLLSVDLRGSSALARAYPPALSVAWLLDFRRLVHDAVATHGGVVDKYVGDGVLALFLDGDAGEQAGQALAAAEAMLDTLTALNRERSRAGCPTLRVIAALHCGPVLAGVFDDGRRAEFTVLGTVMNDLSRIERRAKEEDLDVVASADVLRRFGADAPERLGPRPLPQSGEPPLPRLFALRLGATERPAEKGGRGLPSASPSIVADPGSVP